MSIIPVNIAKKIGIKWWELDADEPNYSGITRNQLSVLGQTTITIKFTTIKMTQSADKELNKLLNTPTE